MLKDRILSTLRFFDLQDWPPTLLELHGYLIADTETFKEKLDARWDLPFHAAITAPVQTPIDQVLKCLEDDCQQEVENFRGFYCLKGRKKIVEERLQNYLYGIVRERLICRFAGGLRHLPFIRGAALSGSQALGQQKETSDIDLLIITHPDFLWLARTMVTIYFQVTGHRRHGKKVANRFCLNHYLNRPKEVDRERNLYKAMEYAKLRPLAYPQTVAIFQANNARWINLFFPNAVFNQTDSVQLQSACQKFLEKIFNTAFGRWLEGQLKSWQIARIKQEDFIFITDDELSFHPESRHAHLLEKFFQASKNAE